MSKALDGDDAGAPAPVTTYTIYLEDLETGRVEPAVSTTDPDAAERHSRNGLKVTAETMTEGDDGE